MQTQEIEEFITELETRVDRLRALYEQYFMGIEKIEPHVARKDVDRRFQTLRREQIRNTAQRFRFQMILQRYNTYQTYWLRTCRAIEEGTYKRDVLRARAKFGDVRERELPKWHRRRLQKKPGEEAAAEASEGDEPFAGSDGELTLDVDFEESFEESEAPTTKASPKPPPPARAKPPLPPGASARAPAPEGASDVPAVARPPTPGPMAPVARPPTPGPMAPPLARPPTPQSMQPLARPVTPAAFSPTGAKGAPESTKDPAKEERMRELARRLAAKNASGAPGAATSASPPAGAAPAAAAPAPTAAAARPAPREAPPREAPPERPKPNKDLTDERMRALYNELVDTKRKHKESTAAVTYEGMVKTLRESQAKLREKHAGRAIDFEVTIKDGKTILRPVVK